MAADEDEPLVEYCLNNVDARARAWLLARGLRLGESSCLQRCGQCYSGPFLVIDGELVAGATHDALLRRAAPGGAAGKDQP